MKYIISIIAIAGMVSCSGGGSSSSSSNSGGSSSGSSSDKSATWKVVAGVSQDGCGERIADVTQTFTVVDSGEDVVVNTGIADTTAVDNGDGFTSSYSDQSGSCIRNYVAQFTGVTSTSANVALTLTSTCGTSVCENKWLGTATRVN